MEIELNRSEVFNAYIRRYLNNTVDDNELYMLCEILFVSNLEDTLSDKDYYDKINNMKIPETKDIKDLMINKKYKHMY